jgi:hypothetical protein
MDGKNPGKYDDVCTKVREETNAAAVAVMVVAGNQGHGFSIQAIAKEVVSFLPQMLDQAAAAIRADVGEDKDKQLDIVQDHKRWRFSVRGMNNPGGPEDTMGELVSRELHDAVEKRTDLSEEQKIEFVIDEAIRRLEAQQAAA